MSLVKTVSLAYETNSLASDIWGKLWQGQVNTISAYAMHNNVAVCKIMEAIGTPYAKSRIHSQHFPNYMRQTIAEGTVLWKESAHHLQSTFQYFSECLMMVLKMCHFSISLVCISKFLYANVLPPAYSVCISLKASACICHKPVIFFGTQAQRGIKTPIPNFVLFSGEAHALTLG